MRNIGSPQFAAWSFGKRQIETIWLRHDWTPQITHPDGIVVTKAPGVLI